MWHNGYANLFHYCTVCADPPDKNFTNQELKIIRKNCACTEHVQTFIFLVIFL
jgi:hypothetical protein